MDEATIKKLADIHCAIHEAVAKGLGFDMGEWDQPVIDSIRYIVRRIIAAELGRDASAKEINLIFTRMTEVIEAMDPKDDQEGPT